MDAVKQAILDHKIIAIMRGVAPEDVLPAARALRAGGIRLMEVTFNQKKGPEETVDAIRAISKELGDVHVGAGTVLTKEQVNAAFDAGAKYMISPNYNPEIVDLTKKLDAISIPGVFTPSEIIACHERGADFAKMFPAGVLGLPYIKAIRAPINHIPLLVVGGVDHNNLKEFLDAGIQGAGIGASIVNMKLIAEKKFDELTGLAEQYTSQI